MLKRSSFFIFIILNICFLSGLWASLNFKQLFNDGAFWALDVANTGYWHVEHDYFRYFTLLLQTPAVIASNLFEVLWPTPLLFSLGYFLFPYIFLGIVFYIFRHHQKKHFLYIFVLTLFISILPNWTFGVSVVNESIVISWLLLSYILISEKPKPQWIFLLSILLFFTYETGIVFLGLAGYIAYREKKLNRFQIGLYGVLILLQGLNIVFRILPLGAHRHFSTSLPYGLKSPFFIYAIFVFLFLLVVRYARNFPRWIVVALAANLTGALIYYLSTLDLQFIWGQTYFDRTWAIPSAFIIMFLGYEALRKNDFKMEYPFRMVVGILMVPGLIHEIRINNSHVKTQKVIQSIINTSAQSCIVVPLQERSQYENDIYIPTWSFPHRTILMNPSRDIKTIIFFENYESDGTLIENNFCELHDGGTTILAKDQYADYRIPVDQKLNFTKVYKK